MNSLLSRQNWNSWAVANGLKVNLLISSHLCGVGIADEMIDGTPFCLHVHGVVLKQQGV